MAVVSAVAHCLTFTYFNILYPESNTMLGFDLCSAKKNRVRCSSWCLPKRDVLGFRFNTFNGRVCCCARRSRNKREFLQKNSNTDICIFERPGESNIGTKCRTDSDCMGMMTACHYRKCLCVPGYHYSPSGRNCVRHCSEYGNTMTPYYGLAIKGKNLEEVKSSADRGKPLFLFCAERCTRITKYKCISADTQPHYCYFSDVGYLDVPMNMREKGLGRKWHLLMRDCV